jgi:hypothetical protein
MGKTKTISYEVKMRQECLFSPILSNIVLDFLSRAIRQEKEIKGFQIGKEEVILWVVRVAQVVEHLPCKLEAQCSYPNSTEINK